MLSTTLKLSLFLILLASGFLAGLNGDFNTSFALLVGGVTSFFLSC